MGWWSFYFFAKLLLYAGGYIDFSVWWNLALAVMLALPARNDRQALTKNLIGTSAAIVLLYHDSWLPSPGRVVSQADNLSQFTFMYVIELLGRFINVWVILQLLIFLALYVLLRRKLRMSTFVFVGILAVMLVPLFNTPLQHLAAAPTAAATPAGVSMPAWDIRSLSPDALNAKVREFYAQENQKQVRMNAPAGAEAFDVVIVHVCSLSWDDLERIGRTDNALFKQFAVTFTQFNSAASYSGPAAIRLLRGNCGQSSHKALYEPVANDCLLMDGLQHAGFSPHWAMNHDAHFGNFFADVRDRGGMPVQPMNLAGVSVAQRSFDGSPIYDDYGMLSRWWQMRLQGNEARSVLYYNTISLHDGNRFEGQSRSADYATRFDRLVSDINRFASDVRASGRPMLLVFVPEHGAALKGDKRQIDGLREIPTPAITHVPVGMVLINTASAVQQANIEAPSSYVAITSLMARFIERSPFAVEGVDMNSYMKDIPVTESIAENDGTLVWRHGNAAMMQTPDGTWSSL